MAVGCRARLEMPGISRRDGLRTAFCVTGRRRREGVWQWATLAKERRMDRRRSVRVQAAESGAVAIVSTKLMRTLREVSPRRL